MFMKIDKKTSINTKKNNLNYQLKYDRQVSITSDSFITH